MSFKEKLLGSWLGAKVLKQGRVLSVEDLGAAYRCISVLAPALRDAPVQPGDKVQVFLPGVGTRTYTPFEALPDHGSFKLLAHLHGSGPGSAWAKQVQAGDELRFLGPDRSLALWSLADAVALLGDETSLAVSRALLDAHGQRAMVTLDVQDIDSARQACARIGLPQTALVKRSTADDHYAALAQRLVAWAGHSGALVLTGSAQSIARVRSELRTVDATMPKAAKAYWSQGKTGLD
jgi:NADPH-dependent ferric siderophore reductase